MKVVHCKKSVFDVYVGRPSKWGNPFVIGPDGDRNMVIDKYEKWLRGNTQLMKEVKELKGKVLACWCAPAKCHGDVLLKIANE